MFFRKKGLRNNMEQKRGIWIAFEGIDGVGKGEQISRLNEKIPEACMVREPGGTERAEKIRNLVLEGNLDAKTETLLMLAARMEHMKEKVWPALEAGQWVVSDRCWMSTLAYQGYGRELGEKTVLALHEIVFGAERFWKPDLTFVFFLNPEQALARVEEKHCFEREETSFYERVVRGYKRALFTDSETCVAVDASESPETIAKTVWLKIQAKLFVCSV